MSGKGGRPTDYREEYNDLAYKYCLLGATDDDLAKFFDVTDTTVNNWKKQYPKFLASIKSGREEADANVANRLYSRAMGYEHKDVYVTQYQGEPVIVPVTKHYPPDTAAAIFWLKNRQRAKWRDKQDHEIVGQDGGPVQVQHQPAKVEDILKSMDDKQRAALFATLGGILEGKTGETEDKMQDKEDNPAENANSSPAG